MSENVIFRNSCCSLPALRQVNSAFWNMLATRTGQHQFGRRLVVLHHEVKVLHRHFARAAAATEVHGAGVGFPQDHDSTSISPLCLPSALSPSMPLIFKK